MNKIKLIAEILKLFLYKEIVKKDKKGNVIYKKSVDGKEEWMKYACPLQKF